MARPRSVSEDALIAALSRVFSDVGYEGATLAQLSAATGLRKASLYHRFPGGKQQMAEEVLGSASGWLQEKVIAPLVADGPPAPRLEVALASLDGFYLGGRKACLLNMLSSPRIEDGPFGRSIRGAFDALVEGFAEVAKAAGHAEAEARRRARRAVMLIQGSLVLARGTGDPEPFRSTLAELPGELIGASARSQP